MAISTSALSKRPSKVAAPPARWTDWMPGRITREDALSEHPCQSLFHENCPHEVCVREARCKETQG
jgi:hypothetical protein